MREVRKARLLAVLSLLAISFALPAVVTRAVDARQRRLPENAALRALEALRIGRVDEARRETARALAFQPVEAPVPPATLVPAYVELARALEKNGLRAESREGAWKAIHLHHTVDQPAEDLAAWILLAEQWSTSDPARFLAALSIAAVESDQAARHVASRVDSGTLARWQAELAPRLGITIKGLPWISFRDLRPVREGPRVPVLRPFGPNMALLTSGSAQMTFSLSAPAKGLRIVADADEALGIRAIAVLQIDGAEPFPLYVMGSPPRVYPIPLPLAAGTHTFRVEYLGDWRSSQEDRNLRLYGLVPGL